MSFKEERICKRCGTKIIYTNEVELNLWESRPGCPACTKTRKPGQRNDDGFEEAAQERDTPEGIAGLFEWMAAERQAVAQLRVQGVITAKEADELERELVTAARTLLGLNGMEPPPPPKGPPAREFVEGRWI